MIKERPKRFSKPQLEKVGVEIVDPNRVRLKCKACKAMWNPNLLEGGRLPRHYWHCPNGCNS